MTKKEKEEYKNKILTELANSKDFEGKVYAMCFKNGVKKETLIVEDIIQEGLLWMGKKTPELLIELYEKGIINVIRYAVHICWRQCVCKPKKGAEIGSFNPESRLLFSMLHNSSFHNLHQVDTTILDGRDEISNIEADTEDNEFKIYDSLKVLAKSEIGVIKAVFIDKAKRKGRRTRDMRDKIQYITDKIKTYHRLSLSINALNRLDVDDKLKLVLTYDEWKEYNVIFDEDLNTFIKTKLLKVDARAVYRLKQKFIKKIKIMDKTILDNIKILNKIKDND